MKELKKCILILIIFMAATLMILNIDERGRQNTGFGGDIAQSTEQTVEYVFTKIKTVSKDARQVAAAFMMHNFR